MVVVRPAALSGPVHPQPEVAQELHVHGEEGPRTHQLPRHGLLGRHGNQPRRRESRQSTLLYPTPSPFTLFISQDVAPKLISAAVVVFRPDNREVADLIFGQDETFVGPRSAWHGNLNVVAVLGALVNYFITS